MALTPLKMGARLRGGLSGVNDGGASNGSGGIRRWSWVARGVAGGGGGTAELGGAGGEG
jgi:hypothetical protein